MKLSLKARMADPKKMPSQDHHYTGVDRMHPKNRLAKISEYGQTTGKPRREPGVYANYPGMSHD
jgi:hypothetical protein